MASNSLSGYAFSVMQAAMKRRALPGGTSRTIQNLITEALDVPENPVGYAHEFVGQVPVNAIPVTGGLDSTVLYYRFGPKVQAYYVGFGQPYAVAEQMALNKLGIKYEFIQGEIPNGQYWKHIIPARNFYLLSLIAERMWGGGDILFGATNGEMPEFGGDKSHEFLTLVNAAFQALPFQVTVRTPLDRETKTDLVTWWLSAGHSAELLKKTISCFNGELYSYSGKTHHCGRCQACLRKWVAFRNNGIEFETVTDVRIGCAKYIEKYKRLMGEALEKRDFTHYSERRCTQDLAAIATL